MKAIEVTAYLKQLSGDPLCKYAGSYRLKDSDIIYFQSYPYIWANARKYVVEAVTKRIRYA